MISHSSRQNRSQVIQCGRWPREEQARWKFPLVFLRNERNAGPQATGKTRLLRISTAIYSAISDRRCFTASEFIRSLSLPFSFKLLVILGIGSGALFSKCRYEDEFWVRHAVRRLLLPLDSHAAFARPGGGALADEQRRQGDRPRDSLRADARSPSRHLSSPLSCYPFFWSCTVPVLYILCIPWISLRHPFYYTQVIFVTVDLLFCLPLFSWYIS